MLDHDTAGVLNNDAAGVLDNDAVGVLPSAVMVSDPAPGVLSASVLDERHHRHDVAGVLLSADVVSAPAPSMLEVHLSVYGVNLDFVSACVLDDDAAGVLPFAVVVSAVVVSAPVPVV